MKRYSWYTLPLLFVILLICIGRCVAQEAALHEEQITQQQSDHPDEKLQQDQQGSLRDEPSAEIQHGAEEIQEALEILRKIRSPVASRLARYTSKPKGFVGTTIYYAKETFTLLFLTSPLQTSPVVSSHSHSSPTKLPTSLAHAVTLLEDVVRTSTTPSDALYLLAEMNFHGNYSHPISYPQAFKYYKELADKTGNSTAQYMLGFMYATGLNQEVGQDHAKSMLYHTFAAEQSDTRSEMTLAYRHHAGISTPRNCQRAVSYYQRVADKAILHYRSGPPGGLNLPRDAYRLADEEGGVYGEGASFISAGPNANRAGVYSDAYADVDDILEFLLFQASKRDLKSMMSLARLYYDGGRGVARNHVLAKKYFMEIAREYWDADGKTNKDASSGTQKLASRAAGYLGRMFLRGEGIEQSFSIARVWFQRGIANGDALSQYSLGLMHLYGYGVEINIGKANDYFGAAADQELAVAQTELGVLFLDAGDVTTAHKYFDAAAKNSHIEAFYYLAEMANEGVGREKSCSTAAIYYKIVVEKAEGIWSSLIEANEAYNDGEHDKALVGYLMAAEQGSENAQANVAWLLDEKKPRWSLLTWFQTARSSLSRLSNTSRLALRYWTRSARQNNFDSIVKMGDYYLNGIGTSSSGHLLPQPENAAACYQLAELYQSAQAMWNLGWMHENGLGGMKQDFHLAKRFYDAALQTNTEAYLPVKLSLFKLRWRSWWNKITFGSIKSIQEEEDTKKKLSFMEWLSEFLEADARLSLEEQQQAAQQYEADDWEGHEQMADGDDYYGDDLEDDLLITLIIGGLITVLVWLFWYRQQQQRALERRQRQAVQQNDGREANVNIAAEQQPDRGVFPPPGDPAWNQWVAGGVGH